MYRHRRIRVHPCYRWFGICYRFRQRVGTVLLVLGRRALEYEMNGGFSTPLSSDIDLLSMKQACFTCPMFEICNGCRKTVKDLKNHRMVEDHCRHMKTLAPDIIKANGLNLEVTPYVYEGIHG